MWLLFAFSGPVMWAASTHIDKYLVERYFKHSDTAVLMVFTALIGLLMLPFILWFVPGVLELPLLSIVVMAASGVFYMGAMLIYLRALQSEEASVIAPLFQFWILWGAVLAYVFLGETLTPLELGGAMLIICGALLLSLDPLLGFKRFKLRLVLLMLGCTFVLALSSVIFKFFAVRDEYWVTTFWTYAGEACFGAALLMVPAYFRQFVELMRSNTRAMFGINASNELINLGGNLGVRYAFLLVPVALVQAVASTTTLFIFFFGVLLTFFAPHLGREDLSRANLMQKGAAALLVAAGVWLVNM